MPDPRSNHATGAAATHVHGSAGALLNEGRRLSVELEQFVAKIGAA